MERWDDDNARLRAISHPARLRMLSTLALADKSASELAREMGISQPAASYHVRTLADAGLIVQTAIRHVRGGREKVYGAAGGSDAAAGAPDASIVNAAVDALQRLIA